MKRRLLSTTLSLSALMALATLGRDTAAQATPAIAMATPSLSAARSLSGLIINDPEAEYNAGNDAFNKGDIDGAIAHFTKALQQKTSYTDANYNRGIAYEAKKDWKDAVSDFTVVITKQPKMYDAYVERGRSYSNGGDFASATKDLSTAISLKPSKPDAYSARGDANFNQKNYDGAVADYTKYFDTATAAGAQVDPLVYDNRGQANYAAQHYDAAIVDFKKVIAVQPQAAGDAYGFLGDCYTAKKDYPAAVEAYTKYITANPNDKTGASLKGRAFAYLDSKQYQPAIRDFDAYLAINPSDQDAIKGKIVAQQGAGINSLPTLRDAAAKSPNDLEILSAYADALLANKDYAGAIAEYNIIIGKDPNRAGALFNRAVAEGQSGDKVKAATDFAAYTHAKPSDPMGFKDLGIYLAINADWKNSITAFTQYLSMKPDDAEGYKYRGLAEYNSHQYTQAEPDLEKFQTLNPKSDPEVDKALADVYGQTGKTGQQIANLERRVAANPSDVDALVSLGEAYITAKQYEKAIVPLSKAITLKPDPTTLFDRGLAYYNLGKAGNTAAYSKASVDASAALAAKPDYSDAAELKADVLFGDKKFKEAGLAYSAYAAMPGISADSKKYAQSQELQSGLQSQDYDSVIKAASDMIATNPNEPSSYLIKGTAEVKKMNYTAAITDLTKYTGMKGDDPEGWYALGFAYAGTKDPANMPNAAAAFEKTLSLKPDNADAATQAGLAWQAQADANKNDGDKAGPMYDKAIADFDKAATIKGTGKEAADALYNEALAIEAKSKSIDNKEPLKQAIVVWQKWLALAPTDPDAPKIKAHVGDLQKATADL